MAISVVMSRTKAPSARLGPAFFLSFPLFSFFLVCYLQGPYFCEKLTLLLIEFFLFSFVLFCFRFTYDNKKGLLT